MKMIRFNSPLMRSRFGGGGLAPLENEIDRIFESALSDFSSLSSGWGPSWTEQFPVDLFQDNENVHLRAELPGLNREDINVEMVEGFLNISGTRKGFSREGREEETFEFSRSIEIPEQIQADKVTAQYENGVLTITMPKREEHRPRKINVSVK